MVFIALQLCSVTFISSAVLQYFAVKKCTHLNLNIRPDQHAPSVEDALHIILALPIPHPRASCIGTKIAQAKKAACNKDRFPN